MYNASKSWTDRNSNVDRIGAFQKYVIEESAKGKERKTNKKIQGFTELTKDCNTGCTTSNQSKQQIGAVCSLQSRLAPAACLQTESSTELLASGRICQNNHCSTCLRKRLWVAFLACSPRASRMRHKKEKKNPSQPDSAPEPSHGNLGSGSESG